MNSENYTKETFEHTVHTGREIMELINSIIKRLNYALKIIIDNSEEQNWLSTSKVNSLENKIKDVLL
jgi:hypothetical protein